MWALFFAFAVLPLASCAPGVHSTQEPFDLGSVDQISFFRGQIAKRLSGVHVDAIRCEGKHCSHVSIPEDVVCVRNGASASKGRPKWDCTASFQGGYRLRTTEVNCDFKEDDPSLAIKDSCRVVYSLYHPDKSIENHTEPHDDHSEGWPKTGLVLGGVLIALVIVAAAATQRIRRKAE